MRVLLIEDEPTLAHSIELMLRSERFDVVLAALGEDGISLAQTGSHDLVLLDLNLPDMSGYDVLRSLRRIKDHNARPDPFGTCWHRRQGQGTWLRSGRLPDQAVP